ncbi:capsular polysaccharide export protein, LipB/KpsS family [Novosphingobium sp. KACC 22771]|uniref:capsular polysaccharide export protein, LipB/KpsS family n=1 Tax=Novosphingobium sp. KACC 22771 TaxID=3025670 RepID=UPI0023664206|nr:hypothetical protein [Novosphingobium sp. KACC 22771]WDF71906.1 hypothetical protein PQ467_14045 [Novosphingobium sp. KACC 22771]
MPIPTNLAIGRIAHFDAFLADHGRALVGWGRKPSGRRAMMAARWTGRPFALLEDGFLRSVGRDDAPLSLIVDDLGCYYDASCPSRIEAATARGAAPDQAARARALIALWRRSGLSKYNHARDYAAPLPARYVLVADQCHGDLSVALGRADEGRFVAMLQSALDDWPDHHVLVKVHPDVRTHRKKGWLNRAALAHPRIRVIEDGCHPVRLIRGAAAVYTVTSLIGFEALIHGPPVHCFGMPFYAGWGLTRDAMPAPARRRGAAIEDLVHAAMVEAARYVDPRSGALWTVEQAIEHAREQRARRLGL